MEKDKHINKELEEIAPLLSKMKKEEDYQVPFNYFEKMEDDIMARVFPKEQPVTANPVPSWWENAIGVMHLIFRPKFALAMASVVVLILAGITIFGPETIEDPEYANITIEEIEQYISSNIDEFDVDLLAESLYNGLSEPDMIDIDADALDQYIDENILDNLNINTLEDLL